MIFIASQLLTVHFLTLNMTSFQIAIIYILYIIYNKEVTFLNNKLVLKNASKNCTIDADFQSSTDTLSAYWKIPDELLPFTPDVYFSIEKKSLYGGKIVIYNCTNKSFPFYEWIFKISKQQNNRILINYIILTIPWTFLWKFRLHQSCDTVLQTIGVCSEATYTTMVTIRPMLRGFC